MNQRNTTAGEETMVDDWRNSAWLFGCGLFYPNWEPLHWARQKTTLSDQRTPNGPATSEGRASRDEPEKTTVMTEEKFFSILN